MKGAPYPQVAMVTPTTAQVNPFEEYNDYFSSVREVMPINDAPEPKRRFIPSQHEEKK